MDLIEKLTGKPLPPPSGNGKEAQPAPNPNNPKVDVARLMPEIIQLIEKKMDLEAIKNQSVREVLAALCENATKKEKALIEKAQQALETMPVLNDLPFEELYLRMTVK